MDQDDANCLMCGTMEEALELAWSYLNLNLNVPPSSPPPQKNNNQDDANYLMNSAMDEVPELATMGGGLFSKRGSASMQIPNAFWSQQQLAALMGGGSSGAGGSREGRPSSRNSSSSASQALAVAVAEPTASASSSGRLTSPVNSAGRIHRAATRSTSLSSTAMSLRGARAMHEAQDQMLMALRDTSDCGGGSARGSVRGTPNNSNLSTLSSTSPFAGGAALGHLPSPPMLGGGEAFGSVVQHLQSNVIPSPSRDTSGDLERVSANSANELLTQVIRSSARQGALNPVNPVSALNAEPCQPWTLNRVSQLKLCSSRLWVVLLVDCEIL